MGLASGIVFDLDDTLYFERDYVLSVFRAVANAVGAADRSTGQIFDFLASGFTSGVRNNAFDRLLTQYPPLADRWKASDLVALYREHRPEVALTAQIRALLHTLSGNSVPLALITDGPVVSQSNKIAALGIADIFTPRILTDSWGVEFRKPHRRAFETIADTWHADPTRLVYVGDNPAKDFFAPRALGWQTARIRTPEQLRYHLEPASPEFAPHFEFNYYAPLARWLKSACGLQTPHIDK
jgi:putative hydrolase of the HAD superfamily